MRTSSLLAACAITVVLCCGDVAAQSSSIGREAAVDPSIDACTDFYGHATRAWVSRNPIPAHLPTYGTGNVVAARTRETLKTLLERARNGKTAAERSAAAYYASCMDTAAIDAHGLDPLRGELRAIGRVRSPSDIGRMLLELQAIGVNATFATGIQPDRHDPAARLVVFRPAIDRLSRSDYGGTSPRSKELRSAYTTYVTRLLVLSGVAEAEALDASAEIVDMEARLATSTLTLAERRDVAKTDNVMTMEQFETVAPALAPARLFELLAVPAPQQVNVTEPHFFETLQHELTSVSPRVWQLYGRFLLLNAYASTLPQPFNDAAATFRAAKTGVMRARPRFQECIAAASSDFGPLLGELYARETLRDETKERVDAIARNVVAAFGEMIDGATWLTPETRTRAKEKLAHVQWRLGAPTVMTTDVPNVGRQAYASAARVVARAAVRGMLRDVQRPSASDGWTLSPAEPNATFDHVRLTLFVTAAELQPPYFDRSADEAWNYGAIGAVIGHELSHAFDDKGARFDATGRLREWWSDADRKAFKARVNCVKERLRHDRVEDVALDADAVAGEAIADRAGLKAALHAYVTAYPDAPVISGLTGRQRVYLSFAQMYARHSRPEWVIESMKGDTHAPDELRLREAIRGSADFDSAFDCHSEPACEIW